MVGANFTKDFNEAKARCAEAITSGMALEKFASFVENQGGNMDTILIEGRLPKAKYIEPVYFEKEGYIASCETSEVGMANLILGGGRATKDSVIDLSVGIDIKKHIGDYVSADEPFAYIHGNDKKTVEEAKQRLISAYQLQPEEILDEQIIKCIIE